MRAGDPVIDYAPFPALAGVYLEDSYVLEISESPGQFTFRLEAVLTPQDPAYHDPLPGERYCYARGNLVFDGVTQVEWMRRSDHHFTDASGEIDLGNIDVLHIDGDAMVAEGDWGEVRIVGALPQFELIG